MWVTIPRYIFIYIKVYCHQLLLAFFIYGRLVYTGCNMNTENRTVRRSLLLAQLALKLRITYPIVPVVLFRCNSFDKTQVLEREVATRQAYNQRTGTDLADNMTFVSAHDKCGLS
jgi:hypothetical protein